MREEPRITIGFHYVDTCKNEYDSNSTVEVFYDLGDTDLSVIGEQLNAFLRQCGYIRHKDMIFMDAVDDEEYDAISAFLADYRKSNSVDVD